MVWGSLLQRRHGVQSCTWVWLACALFFACQKKQHTPKNTRVFSISHAPDTLDPRFIRDPAGLRLTRLLHRGLLSIDPDTLAVEAALAQSYEVVGDRLVRLRLRSGLRFSDGSPLTVKDVLATYDALARPSSQSPYAAAYRRFTLEAKDNVIEVRLKEAHAAVLTDLEFPILKRSAVKKDAPAHNFVGAGPFILETGAESGSRVFRLRKNPHFVAPDDATYEVDGRPVELRLVRDDTTRALRLINGDDTLAFNSISPSLFPRLLGDKRKAMSRKKGAGTLYIGLNLERPGLKARARRAALLAAIDREALVKYKLHGLGSVAHSWMPEGHWGASDARTPSYDPEHARNLLGDEELEFELLTDATHFRESVAAAVARMLEAVGVGVRVRISEHAALMNDLRTGNFDLVLLEFPELIEPHVLSFFFHSEHIPSAKTYGGNRWRLRSATVDALLESGRKNLDRQKRIEIYRMLDDALKRELPVLPLWHADVVVFSNDEPVAATRHGRFDSLWRKSM